MRWCSSSWKRDWRHLRRIGSTGTGCLQCAPLVLACLQVSPPVDAPVALHVRQHLDTTLLIADVPHASSFGLLHSTPPLAHLLAALYNRPTPLCCNYALAAILQGSCEMQSRCWAAVHLQREIWCAWVAGSETMTASAELGELPSLWRTPCTLRLLNRIGPRLPAVCMPQGSALPAWAALPHLVHRNFSTRHVVAVRGWGAAEDRGVWIAAPAIPAVPAQHSPRFCMPASLPAMAAQEERWAHHVLRNAQPTCKPRGRRGDAQAVWSGKSRTSRRHQTLSCNEQAWSACPAARPPALNASSRLACTALPPAYPAGCGPRCMPASWGWPA